MIDVWQRCPSFGLMTEWIWLCRRGKGMHAHQLVRLLSVWRTLYGLASRTQQHGLWGKSYVCAAHVMLKEVARAVHRRQLYSVSPTVHLVFHTNRHRHTYTHTHTGTQNIQPQCRLMSFCNKENGLFNGLSFLRIQWRVIIETLCKAMYLTHKKILLGN